jgi:hypothetical protein
MTKYKNWNRKPDFIHVAPPEIKAHMTPVFFTCYISYWHTSNTGNKKFKPCQRNCMLNNM